MSSSFELMRHAKPGDQFRCKDPKTNSRFWVAGRVYEIVAMPGMTTPVIRAEGSNKFCVLTMIGNSNFWVAEWEPVVQAANPMLDVIEKKSVNPHAAHTCQCGAWKLNYARGPLHSRWCPDFDATPPVRPESHEELVARVRATRKGARANNP